MTFPRIKPSHCLLPLAFIILCGEGALAQNRTFSERPEILLGLKSDRSPSLTFVDVDEDVQKIIMRIAATHTRDRAIA